MASPQRLSPQVQLIQQSSPYNDIYTNAAVSPLRTRSHTQHLHLVAPHGHPEKPRWEEPGGWGARHMNDTAPFTLWDAEERKFHFPSREQISWIEGQCETPRIFSNGWLLCIETDCPPKPVPLTLGNMPVKFVRCGEMFEEPLPRSGYSNPRVPDPCRTLRWPNMTHPTKSQIVAVLTAIAQHVNVRSAIFFPFWTIFELETGDGRSYERSSLPGVVAGRTALYRHEDRPFLDRGRSLTRPRLTDLSQLSAAGTTPQDNSNYLRNSYLTPGCRLECGYGPTSTQNEFTTAATTCGVKIRKSTGEERLTVANHGFLASREVYHPFVEGGDLIGEVVDTRSELDIALVKLTPSSSSRFMNSCYFQSEPPTRLLEGFQIQSGSWSEVDGMSSGLFSMMSAGIEAHSPVRPPGHPKIDFTKWDHRMVSFLFGFVDNLISDGVCGAPIVDVETGGVSGFFHLSDGNYAVSAVIDDLLTEGWALV